MNSNDDGGYTCSAFGNLIGMLRIRCPVAANTAFPIAGAIAMIGVSPAPAASTSSPVHRVHLDLRHILKPRHAVLRNEAFVIAPSANSISSAAPAPVP